MQQIPFSSELLVAGVLSLAFWDLLIHFVTKENWKSLCVFFSLISTAYFVALFYILNTAWMSNSLSSINFEFIFFFGMLSIFHGWNLLKLFGDIPKGPNKYRGTICIQKIYGRHGPRYYLYRYDITGMKNGIRINKWLADHLYESYSKDEGEYFLVPDVIVEYLPHTKIVLSARPQ